MIYLIESAGFEKTDSGETTFFKLLKIGYTKDKNKGTRYSNYRMHNPTCIVLKEIPNATEKHEKLVQEKFRKLRYEKYGNEWFYYDQSIIDFFNKSTIADLDNLKGAIKIKNRKKLNKVASTIRNEILKLLFGNVIEINEWLSKIILNYGKCLTVDQALEYLKKNNIDLTGYYCVSSGIFSNDEITNKTLKKFMRNFLRKENKSDKVRYIVENKDKLSQDQLTLFLKCIDRSISNYITILGLDGCKACGYNITHMNNACKKKKFDPEIIKEAINSNFKVGDRISLFELKSKLKDIYKSIGYTETPKAIDITKYFEVKDISFYEKQSDGRRRRIKGYELIKKLINL